MKNNFNIAETMSVLLNPATVQKKASVQSAEDAVTSLNAAAEILDNMGLFVVAEAVTNVMESVPQSLRKSAQTYGHDVDKYVLDTLYDGLMAIRSKLSDIRSEEEAKPRLMPGYIDTYTHISVTNKDFDELSKIEERLGKIQTYMENAPEGKAGFLLGALLPASNLLYRKAKSYWSSTDKKPEAIMKLYRVHNALQADNRFKELYQMMRAEEEDTGKDYAEPTVEFERFKEHEYMHGEHGEEESMLEDHYDEYWSDEERNHPEHPLYRD